MLRESPLKLSHVNRKANGVADALAKLTRNWNSLYNWSEVPETIKLLAAKDVIDILHY